MEGRPAASSHKPPNSFSPKLVAYIVVFIVLAASIGQVVFREHVSSPHLNVGIFIFLVLVLFIGFYSRTKIVRRNGQLDIATGGDAAYNDINDFRGRLLRWRISLSLSLSAYLLCVLGRAWYPAVLVAPLASAIAMYGIHIRDINTSLHYFRGTKVELYLFYPVLTGFPILSIYALTVALKSPALVPLFSFLGIAVVSSITFLLGRKIRRISTWRERCD
jgi:hypothetical protein